MNYAEFINYLRDKFYLALEAKTNWGRNDLKMEFERVIGRLLAELLEKEINK